MGLQNPWTDSPEIFKFYYVHRPTWHAKYGGRRKCRVGWAYGWSCTLACFLFIFWLLQRTRSQHMGFAPTWLRQL